MGTHYRLHLRNEALSVALIHSVYCRNSQGKTKCIHCSLKRLTVTIIMKILNEIVLYGEDIVK